MFSFKFYLMLLTIKLSRQHAIFWEPPARQSMAYAKPSCNLPVNYDHMSVWCGGAPNMHNSVNKGRCGVCGDEFSAAVKPNEAGGRFATGTLARSYLPGQEIEVKVKLVANHKGFFTFALCPHNNPNTAPSRECFLQHQLTVNNGKRYYATTGNGFKTMRVKLPNLTCQQCIFQATYTSGNNWGAGPQSAEVQTQDCLTTAGKLGCGPQETFRGCSDICIGSNCPQGECAKVGGGGGGTTGPVTTRPQVDKICVSAGIKRVYFSQAGDRYCKQACLNKTRKECHAGANTKFLCYCTEATGREESYAPVILDQIVY